MNLRQSSSVKEFNLLPLHRYSKKYYLSPFSRFSQNRTRMTLIKRIFTDLCASASSAQSAFYRLISLLIFIPEHQGHRENQQNSVLSVSSVSSVVDYPCAPISINLKTCPNSHINNYIHQS
jgi:hypothetical protein